MTLSALFDQLYVVFAVVGLVLAGPLVAAGIVSWGRWKLRRERRTPLTSEMLRGPGESLRAQIEDLHGSVGLQLTYLFSIPAISSLLLLATAHIRRRPIDTTVAVTLGLIVATVMVFWGYRSVVGVRRLWRLRLALDGEVAVGQELQNLMLSGARVYHDFPAEGFNIDHVVIGPGGVVAVETKARSKPNAPERQRKDSVRVVYDGKSLQFPTHIESKPVAQAERQALWLARWLTSAVGWNVEVTPALAIPGWFIEHKAFEPVRVFNGKNPGFLLKPRRGQSLDAAQIQAIAHQVEQRCRNVRPGFLPKST